MIKFDQVSKRYPGGHEALKGVSFHIERNEMVFLTGHSGAGKSTLLKLMMLMERPTQGQVLVNGQNLRGLPDRKIPALRRDIGVVFQNHQLLFDRSVFDNVALPLVIAGFQPRDVGRRVRAALDKVGLLSKEKLMPITLSGGEQQRVGIARAVVNKPAILLADEPTGNLDPELSAEIMHLFEQFNQVGVTVLIASHDLSLIARLPYRMMTLREGMLVSGVGEARREPEYS
jgi:cell division transport system ATP-binding protein